MNHLPSELHVRRASHGHESVRDKSLADFTFPKGTEFKSHGPSKVPGYTVIEVPVFIRVPNDVL